VGLGPRCGGIRPPHIRIGIVGLTGGKGRVRIYRRRRRRWLTSQGISPSLVVFLYVSGPSGSGSGHIPPVDLYNYVIF